MWLMIDAMRWMTLGKWYECGVNVDIVAVGRWG